MESFGDVGLRDRSMVWNTDLVEVREEIFKCLLLLSFRECSLRMSSAFAWELAPFEKSLQYPVEDISGTQ